MIEVTCALIRNDEGLVLIVRRGPGMTNGGRWEFPGGKRVEGESYEDCIIREIDEELGMEIVICGRLDETEHDYADFGVRLIPFVCDTLAHKPILHEHDDYRWINSDELLMTDLTPPDIPVAAQYAELYGPGETAESEEPVRAVIREADREIIRLMSRVGSAEGATCVAKEAVEDPELLSQLVSLCSHGDRKTAFTASWALSKVADTDREALVPYLPMIIEALPSLTNESVQRAFMRILHKIEIGDMPVSHHARLIDYSIGLMRNRNAAVAPKAYGMEIVTSFCSLYPELVSEALAAVQIAVSEESGGVKSAGEKMIKRLLEK